MNAPSITAPGTAPQVSAPAFAKPRRDWPTLLFVLVTAGIAMSVRQEYTGQPTGLEYWLFLAPGILVALCRPLALAHAMTGKAALLVAMLVIAGSWHMVLGDTQVVAQLGLLVLVYTWHNAAPVQLRVDDLERIYVIMVIAGAIVWLTLDINRWGLIPGTTATEFGIWRVSFFPNLAFSGFLSMAVIFVLTRNGWAAAAKRWVFWLAVYFAIFSFVRTAVICLVVYAVLYAVFRRGRIRSGYMLIPILTAVGVSLFIAYSAVLFASLQELPLVSRLFLRGEVGLSVYEVYQQLYRPWLWGQQLNQFWTSDYLMGWGSTDFATLITESLVVSSEFGDTVSLPTRLLAQFGLPGVLFTIYLVVCLKGRADARDIWACSIWAPVVISLMQWGSLFHPTDGIGFLFMLMIVKGTSGYPEPAKSVPRSSVPATAAAAA